MTKRERQAAEYAAEHLRTLGTLAGEYNAAVRSRRAASGQTFASRVRRAARKFLRRIAGTT